MKRALTLIAIATLGACGSLPDSGDGIVALEITQPDSLQIALGQSRTLHARALDANGDVVATPVYWRSPDTTFITIDSVTGVITGRAIGSARVQARVGTLISDILTFSVHDSATGTGLRQ